MSRPITIEDLHALERRITERIDDLERMLAGTGVVPRDSLIDWYASRRPPSVAEVLEVLGPGGTEDHKP